MSRPATMLAKVDAAGDTADKANEHAKDARRKYRAALLVAFEAGVTVTELARRRRTSWSRLAQQLDKARAERGGLASLN